MSMSKSFASLAIGGAALLFAAGSANAVSFTDFPSIGLNVDGPALLITLGSGGATISQNPGNSGPYDGVEDSYIGLWNNTSQSVSFVTLTGPGIFGFDGDGIGAPNGAGNATTASCATCQYGTPNGNDPSGYGGPIGYFSNIVGSTGDFNILGGLAPGAFTWFSLEEQPTLTSFAVTGVGSTPLPATLPLFAGGLGLMGLVARRRKRKTV